ncbi:nitrogen regulation protein NR(II) [Geothrix sp. 21YS21S-2]|uniref:two-component system sensor histidine kinase NtrB n=1 Tax=Geothrix sp. 21YS21S-2 TaxID=3068893 RepID=UPI0027B89024|nr:ATP-binding protein [Geothrix sp. 21YS21S-2]
MFSRSGPGLGWGLLAACALIAAFGLVAANRLNEGIERTLLLAAALMAAAFMPVLAFEVRHAHRAKRDDRALVKAFQGSPLPIFALDREGRIQRYWNPAAESRFRLAAAEVMGRPMPVALPGLGQELGHLLERAFLGEPIGGIQGQGRPSAGPAFPLTLHMTPLRGAGNRVEAVLVILLDATEARNLEQQLLHSQKLETAGEFLSSVTHDVNTILTSILGCNELLLRDPHLSPEQKRRLEVMRRGASRGHALAARLLRYVRKAPTERQCTDLNELVLEVAALLKESAGSSVSFRCQLDPDLPAPLVEPTEIHQVIMNLGTNARDAMPGGGDLTFRTRLAGPGEAPGLPRPVVLLEVQDTGTGIPAEVLGRMFEPFFTTKGAGKGTGLGLAVVDRIVKAHGGQVRCSSREGEGALFQVFLPC